MRVDVQLDDSELALLAGYNRSTTMGIKKPGELQRELLSDMENIEEKREVQAIPEEQDNDVDTVKPKESVSASEDEEEEVKSAPVRVRSDFLSMLSAMAQPNTHEDKDSEDSEVEGEDTGILPEDEEEEDVSTLPEDEDEEDVSTLPEDEDEEDVSVLPEDKEEEDVSVLPEDEEEEDVSTLPEDDEYDGDVGILPADDEDAEGESVTSEEPTTGITEQQEDGYSSELPADEDDEKDSSVLPDDSEDDYSVLPDDEDEEDASVLPADEDEDSSVLPEGNEEVEDEPTPAGIQEPAPTATHVVEHPVSPSHKVQKSAHHAANQPTAHPVGYSAPSVPLYDFILNNGGSMLIEDIKKYYPIDEVKKALNLGKIYRFGNKVGV